MAALAPIPSASERIATTVTNGVLNSVRKASLRFRMAVGATGERAGGTGLPYQTPRSPNLVDSGAPVGRIRVRPQPGVTRYDGATVPPDSAAVRADHHASPVISLPPSPIPHPPSALRRPPTTSIETR